jgi:hypothetical protein
MFFDRLYFFSSKGLRRMNEKWYQNRNWRYRRQSKISGIEMNPQVQSAEGKYENPAYEYRETH